MKPIAVVAVLLLAACASPPARNWSDVQANCAQQPPPGLDAATCHCAFARMQQRMPFERFAALQAQAKPVDDWQVVRGPIGPRTMATAMANSKDELPKLFGESVLACLK